MSALMEGQKSIIGGRCTATSPHSAT